MNEPIEINGKTNRFLTWCYQYRVMPAAIRALMSQWGGFKRACSLYDLDSPLFFTINGSALRFDDFCCALNIGQKEALYCFNSFGMSLDELVVYCGCDGDHKWERAIKRISSIRKKQTAGPYSGRQQGVHGFPDRQEV